MAHTLKGSESAVTYRFEGAGRFGDCVMIYCKAKYCSFASNLPLLYKPFPHSELLMLDKEELRYNPALDRKFVHKPLISSADEIDPTQENTLFITDLFTMFAGKQPTNPNDLVIPAPYWMNFWPDEIYAKMQENSNYKEVIRTMLSPINPAPQLQVPVGTISVAIHVRKGGGIDSPLRSPQLYNKNYPQLYQPQCTGNASDVKFPLRFPPEQFYIDQLNFLAALLNQQQLSVFLFTDDCNPRLLFNRLQEQCDAPNIHFIAIYRSANFIDDLNLMAQADCLIRPCSHFSGVAQLMGNHKIIIRPEQSVWRGPLLIISEAKLILHGEKTTEYVSFTNAPIELLKTKLNALF